MTENHTRLTGGGDTLIEPWFHRAEHKDANLTDDEADVVRQLKTEGLAVIDLLVEEDDAYFDQFLTSLGPDYGSLPRQGNLWKRSAPARAIAGHERVLNYLRKAYGRDPFPFQTLNFPHGTEQATHSDTIHFNTYPEHFMCGVWVALEDITPQNGPLHYYPGSHMLPSYALSDIGIVSNGKRSHAAYERFYEPFVLARIEQLGLERVELTVKRGQAVIWCANLLHGGSPILDKSRTRHSQVTHYYFKGCVYYTPMFSDPMLRKIAYTRPHDIRTGRRVNPSYLGKNVSIPIRHRVVDWMRDIRDILGL